MAYTRLNLSDGEIFNASHVTHIEDELVDLDENKADQSDVDKITEDVSDLSKTVDTKADQSDLESLQTSVEQNTSDISDLSKTVDTKADKSDVEQNTKDIATNAENIATNTGNIATNADAISELNSALTDFQCGNTGTINATASTYTDCYVKFDTPFSKVPIVTVSIQINTTLTTYSDVIPIVFDDVTTEGFTVRVINNTTGDRVPTVNWIAIAR